MRLRDLVSWRGRALALVAVMLLAWPARGATHNLFGAAMNSITTDELHEHVATLADDVYEGRGAGSRGGHAAGQYIVQQLRQYGVAPAGSDGDYFQAFDDEERNILSTIPGDDPHLADEIVLVGAHYDHVGYGRKSNSYGPTGQIHNGADDNASGVSELLEAIQAFTSTGLTTRRSLLFAFWDGEERGLLGSKHWVAEPTVPLEKVKLSVTLDMVGRLRKGQLYVLGTRTGYGLRQLMSGPVDDPLWLDFDWELSGNSDHWSFVERQIPVVLLHTGMHSDYHRPTDDVEKINNEGMREVGQYLLAVLVKVANADALPKFRPGGQRETSEMQEAAERTLKPVSLGAWPSNLPRPRLGISWRIDDAAPGTVFVTRVVYGTPAAAAELEAGDRIYAINGRPFADENEFQRTIDGLIDGGTSTWTFDIETLGQVRTVTVRMASSQTAQ